jgi:hypothetical protein
MLMRLSALLLTAVSLTYADDARSILDHLSAKARRIRAIRADVTIEVAIPSFKVPRAHGVLTIVPPDSISFRSEQLTFLPKGGLQLNPLLLLQQYKYIAVEEPNPNGDRYTKVLRLFPTPDTGDMLAAKLILDLRDTTITRADITMRTGGHITLDLAYGAYRRDLLPDRMIMTVTMVPITIPKVITGEVTPSARSEPARLSQTTSGTITIEFLRYTHIERRNFLEQRSGLR